jgi:small subunit ribosomal protein S1
MATTKKSEPAKDKAEEKEVKAETKAKKEPKKSAPAEKKTKKTEKTSATPKKAKTAKKPQTMEELLASTEYTMVIPQKGTSITGTITEKQKRALIVDIGAKTEGVVSDKEFDFASDFIKDLNVGDEIKALVISSENDRGQVVLSLKGAASDAKWEFFEDALENETVLEAKGLEVNRGGLIITINGIRGFVPSSQFGRAYVGKIAQLKGETVKVKAIEVDREKNRLIFSERHVSEEKELAQKEQALENVQEGAVYEGVVSGVMHFGLFVTVEVPVAGEKSEKADTKDKKDAKKNIGYVEGLIHISEISWEKVNHPRDYHNVGDRIEVKVLGIDEKTGKLNLSIKQLDQDPWEKIAENYSPGTSFTGKVSRIEQFGVFVNVEPGVDGLIHATKLDPSQDLKPGDEVTVSVESISPEQRRMSLSMVLTEVPMGYK